MADGAFWTGSFDEPLASVPEFAAGAVFPTGVGIAGDVVDPPLPLVTPRSRSSRIWASWSAFAVSAASKASAACSTSLSNFEKRACWPVMRRSSLFISETIAVRIARKPPSSDQYEGSCASMSRPSASDESPRDSPPPFHIVTRLGVLIGIEADVNHALPPDQPAHNYVGHGILCYLAKHMTSRSH